MPQAQHTTIDLPSGEVAEIRRTLREEILSFPTEDHALDSWTQGIIYFHREHAPKPKLIERHMGSQLQVIFISI